MSSLSAAAAVAGNEKFKVKSTIIMPKPSVSSLKRKASEDTGTIAGTNTSRTNTDANSRNTRPRIKPTTKIRAKIVPTSIIKPDGKKAVLSSVAKADENTGEVNVERKEKKRPKWDLRGRVQDLENENILLRQKDEECKKSLNDVTEKFDESKNKMQKLLELRDSLESKVQATEKENTNMAREICDLKYECQTSKEHLRVRDSKIAELEKALEVKSAECTKMESKVRQEETMRRKLHNTIQELKGNIRVFCRVRPPLQNELVEKEVKEVMSHINFSENEEENSIELSQLTESVQGSKPITKNYPFTFDRVFQPGVSQGEVFDEISQLVQSALDGYPVCIFAYGQTGSGKTFTMEGPDSSLEDPRSMGMIPRAVKQIFVSAEELKVKGWTYEMEAQFLEIYNENIRDLLAPRNDENRKHEIKHDNVSGKSSVTDMTTVVVHTPHEVQSVLKTASRNRAVGATQCNERSSRSHSVFILKLTGHNSVTGENSEGILNLIDLAGSERLSASGSTGERLKETQAINKSLACLGDVILALANKSQHIPYRNSKLTYLLQNSLGGNSKTLMFVNISPLCANFHETLYSLQFAAKVNSCQIGTARKQIKM